MLSVDYKYVCSVGKCVGSVRLRRYGELGMYTDEINERIRMQSKEESARKWNHTRWEREIKRRGKKKRNKGNSMLWRCFCGEAAYSWKSALNGTACCTQRFLSSFLSGFHVCCECKKTYRSRMALNRHVREECGRILYTCPFCHSIMPMKFNLLNHLKKEHGCVTKIWSDLISVRAGSFLANDFSLSSVLYLLTSTTHLQRVDAMFGKE